MLTASGGIGIDLMDESDTHSPSLPEDTDPLESHLVLESDKRALQRLVNRSILQDELPFVIGTIVSNMNSADIVKCLQASEAQTFIDVIDEACHHPIQSLGDWFTDPRFNSSILLFRR